MQWNSHTEAGGDTTQGVGGVAAYVSKLLGIKIYQKNKSLLSIGQQYILHKTVYINLQVGFNAGNGTRSYEYYPYSQRSTVRDLVIRGWANGFPGRHIFRIDENIILGTCNKDIGKCR